MDKYTVRLTTEQLEIALKALYQAKNSHSRNLHTAKVFNQKEREIYWQSQAEKHAAIIQALKKALP